METIQQHRDSSKVMGTDSSKVMGTDQREQQAAAEVDDSLKVMETDHHEVLHFNEVPGADKQWEQLQEHPVGNERAKDKTKGPRDHPKSHNVKNRLGLKLTYQKKKITSLRQRF